MPDNARLLERVDEVVAVGLELRDHALSDLGITFARVPDLVVGQFRWPADPIVFDRRYVRPHEFACARVGRVVLRVDRSDDRRRLSSFLAGRTHSQRRQIATRLDEAAVALDREHRRVERLVDDLLSESASAEELDREVLMLTLLEGHIVPRSTAPACPATAFCRRLDGWFAVIAADLKLLSDAAGHARGSPTPEPVPLAPGLRWPAANTHHSSPPTRVDLVDGLGRVVITVGLDDLTGRGVARRCALRPDELLRSVQALSAATALARGDRTRAPSISIRPPGLSVGRAGQE
ncbi:MAG: hypothetical protein ACRD1K_21120 [Acidimicrobiales bacterium]